MGARGAWRAAAGGIAAAALSLAACVTPTPVQRAISLAHMNHPEEGVALLRADLAKHPDDVDARRVLVRLLGLTGDLKAAKKEAEDLQKHLQEGDPSGWLELGHAYELSHKFEEALAAYDAAASAAPGSPAGPLEGGNRTAHWGEIDEARPRLEEAVRRGANDAEVWHTLGYVRLRQKDFDGAAEAYRKGLDVDGSQPQNWLGLASVAVMQGDAKGALAAYTSLLGLRPNLGAAELGRAWALAKLGRTKEAYESLDHAAALGAPRANIDKQRAALAKPKPPTEAPGATAPRAGSAAPVEPLTPEPLPPTESPDPATSGP